MEYGAGAQPWFDSEEPAVSLGGAADSLLSQDHARLAKYERYYKLYGGTRLIGLRPWEHPVDQAQLAEVNQAVADRLRLNVVKATIDTITAKVGKLRPRPTFLTSGGDWSLQLKAKRLQKFMDGAYHQADAYELGPEWFRDAMVFGTGIIHPHRCGTRLRAERTRPWELFVDVADALYGAPRCLYKIKWASVQAVRAKYGDRYATAALDALAQPKEGDDVHRAGYVRLIEAWCLPVSEDSYELEPRADNGRGLPPDAERYGRHVVLVGGECALEEDYPCPSFPFVFLHWTKPVQGFWGDSAVQEVVGIQVEINRLLQGIQDAMIRTGQPIVLTRDEVILSPTELDNRVALQVKVKGDWAGPLSDVVQVLTFQPVSPMVIQHLWALYEKAFEILGSNQLAASASAPAGLESGRALEQLAEEESERFMTVSRHYEHAMGELLPREFIRLAKEIDSELRAGGKSDGFVIRSPGSKQSLTIKWREVEMDSDAYLTQVFPTSVLPTTPAARIQEVERLAQAQWIDATEARRLLDFPDLQQSTNLAVADMDCLLHQLEQMVEEGKQVLPEPYQDLERAMRWATATILRATADGVPDRNIARVRDFVTACEGLLRQSQAEQEGQAARAAALTQAAPPQPAGGGEATFQPAGGAGAPPALA